jgi:hypothetical protein
MSAALASASRAAPVRVSAGRTLLSRTHIAVSPLTVAPRVAQRGEFFCVGTKKKVRLAESALS